MRVVRDVGGVSGTVLFEATTPEGAPVPGRRAAIVARMHGNEPLGDPVLERLAEVVAGRLIAGSILAVRANERAAEQNVRHTAAGSDLNRLWDAATIARLAQTPREAMSYEETRAADLAPLLETCDAILDLHSTSRPAAPFLVLRDDQAHAALALRLGVRNLVTGVHENGVLSGGMAANLGLWPGERGPRFGFVFEAGQHTDPANGARAWEVAERFLVELGLFAAQLPPHSEEPQIYEIVDRFLQAPAGIEQYRFVGFEGGEQGGGRRGLPPRRLHSFEEIQADEMVLRRGRSEVVRAESPFTMLMPAPTTPPGTDLYYLAQPRHGGLTLGEPRTDLEARREALAIERALDLVADDEFERGATWVGFDTRRLFDLCALVVARQSRLSASDPHRCITIVGRGDHGLDESDRRAGQRYRHAMKSALTEGVRVERVQLLRGAPLAWLDQLTGPSMCELVGQRASRSGDAGGVSLRFSLTHPHTVSLLVAGDPARALETGDTRKVRVVLLIEAATVEADGPRAVVRVVRSGLVSARREVLLAACRMLQGLRADHAWLREAGPLKGDRSIDALSAADGALLASEDPVRMGALRDALRRVVWRSWVERLRPEVVDGTVLRTETERGRWLASTMHATGILDADALSGLLIPTGGGGAVVDASVLDADHPPDPPGEAEPAEGRGIASVPALFAHEVTADDLERWVGFVRFARSVQVIPDTRGKDLDLLFDAARIRRRLATWYDEARRRAAERPVLVVVAGDGMRSDPDAAGLYAAHHAMVAAPGVRYLRLQHAQSATLPWLRELSTLLHGRADAAVRFEVEHGSTVNLVLVCEAPEGAVPALEDLEAWEVTATAVVLSDLASARRHLEEVALFTDAFDGDRPCAELIAFGRAHCDRLIRSTDGAPDLEGAVKAQLIRWIERVRVFRPVRASLPDEPAARGRWVARRFGLSDPSLAAALAACLDDDVPAAEHADRLWRAGASPSAGGGVAG
jgi:predicted deacylase